MQNWEHFATQAFRYTPQNCSEEGFRFRVGKFGLVDWFNEEFPGYITVNELRWNVLFNFVWARSKDHVDVFKTTWVAVAEDSVKVDVKWNPAVVLQNDDVRRQVSFLAVLFFENEVQESQGRFQVAVPKTPSVLQTTFTWRGANIDLSTHQIVKNHHYVKLFAHGKEGVLCTEDIQPPTENENFLLVHDSDRALKTWRSRIPSSTYITNRTKAVSTVDTTKPVLIHVDKLATVQDLDWNTVYVYTSCLDKMVPLKSKRVVMIDNDNSRFHRNLSLFFIMGVRSEVLNLVQNDASNVLFFHTLSSVLYDVSDLEARQVQQVCKS